MTDQVAVVTGVGKPTGLGYEICAQLAETGVKIVLTARNRQKVDALAADLNARYPDQIIPFALDITDDDQIDGLAAMLEEKFGKLDILVNNAAAISPFGERAATADMSAARAVFDATLFGTWTVCRKLLPLIRKSDAGRIVNISSGAGSHGDAMFGLTTQNQMGTSYAVSKAALNALTVKLALEETTETVRINAVCPGFTATFEGAESMGARPVADSAKGIIWAATLPKDGPTAGFFRDGEPLPW